MDSILMDSVRFMCQQLKSNHTASCQVRTGLSHAKCHVIGLKARLLHFNASYYSVIHERDVLIITVIVMMINHP